jgi:hypothetical protein
MLPATRSSYHFTDSERFGQDDTPLWNQYSAEWHHNTNERSPESGNLFIKFCTPSKHFYAHWRCPCSTDDGRLLQEVHSFVAEKKLPRLIRDRVLAHCSIVTEKGNSEDDQKILNMLSTTLRRDVLMHVYARLIETVPFFRNKSDDFLCDLILRLKPEVRHKTTLDFIFLEGYDQH